MKELFLAFGCASLAWAAVAQVYPKMTAVRQVDADTNGMTTPGDILRYTVTFTNTSSTNLLNVLFSDPSYPNQTLVPGSIKTTPIARPDSTNAIGNTLLAVAAPGVLANDSDPDGDTVAVHAFSPTSENGGTVSVAANGGFTYISAAGFTGTDTFTYTINDGNGGTSTAAVTVTVAARVWYVNNAGSNGDGRQTSPFNSLTGAAAASGVNDFIYLFQGSGSYTTGITLKSGQQLVGSGDALVVSGTTIYLAGVRPAISVASGTGLTLATDNVVHGLNISSASGRGISGATAGNLVISNVIASATGGAAVNLAGGTVLVTLDSATSTNSADNGIALSSVNGSLVVNGGSITGAAGTDFSVAAGNGIVAYAGGINNTAGRSVDISGRTGGTVTLSGNITDTAMGLIVQNNTGGTINLTGTTKAFSTGTNTAVNLVNNTGSTINLTGGMLAITRTSGIGFNATGGGTISVTGAGNTIGSGSGIGLNVANTTIDANGLTFESIAANGASSGIILNSTGAGQFTVTGDGGGTNNGSGGIIQNSTGPGMHFTSTGPIRLGYVSVQNGADDGIRGSMVASFGMNRATVNGNGNAVGERGIELTQLSGSGGITNSTISGSAETNLRIENGTANLTAFNVTGTTISAPNFTTGDDGFLVLNTGSASMTVSVVGCTFTDNKGDHFQAATDSDATGPMNIIFNKNTLTTTAGNDPNVIGGGITINTSGSADISFQILSNNIQQAFADAININLDAGSQAGASITGTIAYNTIGTNDAPDSGSESSNDITVVARGQGTVTVAVTNNTLFQYANAYGIFLGSAEGPSWLNATVMNNSVKDPGTFALNGIRVDAGVTVGDSGTVCAHIVGNNVTGSGLFTDDIRLRQRFNTTMRLPGYAGANGDTSAVNAFVAANNDPPGAAPPPTVSSVHNVGGGGLGFLGGSPCLAP